MHVHQWRGSTGIPLLGGNPIYSISNEKRQNCRLVSTANGLMRRFLKNSNDPTNTVGNAHCKKRKKKILKLKINK